MPKAKPENTTPHRERLIDAAPNIVRLDEARPGPANAIRLRVADLRAWARAKVPLTQPAELLGVMPDGRLVLWSTDVVQPMNGFPDAGSWGIAAGHYVLDWNGHVVAANCSSCVDGTVDIMLMGGGTHERMSKRDAEKLLLGRVGTDEARRRISEMLKDLHRSLVDRHNAKHLQRGRLP
jgi:hypothetical protein